MLRAYNSKSELIYINDAIKQDKYFCPFCGSEVRPRQGKVNAWTFSHLKNDGCYEFDYNNEMSKWHIWWQNIFPNEYKEIIITNNYGIKRRADICIENVVIEFQHSPITPDEFRDRNRFYKSCGYKVIWLFDGTSCDISYVKTNNYGNDLYRWKHAPKTLNYFSPSSNKDVKVYVEIDSENDDYEYFSSEDFETCNIQSDTKILPVNWISNDGLKYFTSNDEYDETSFIAFLVSYSANNKRIQYNEEEKSILEFFNIYRDINVAIFFNKSTLETFKVYKNSYLNYEKYLCRLYGYPLNPITNKFEDSIEIKNADKNEWLLQKILS